MQQRLQHLKGDTNPKHLDKVFAPDGGYMGKINSAVKLLQVWIEEESTLKQAPAIIQDRLIFGATNLTPMLHLKGRLLFELSAACALVKGWQRAFDREAEAAKVEKAEKERRAAKKARTEQPATPSAPAEERCEAIKAWPGQQDVVEAITLSAGEIIFRIKDLGDGWSKVRRERDDTTGLVPSKRLRAVPLPPAEEEAGGEPEEGSGQPPAPAVSDDDEEMDAEDMGADAAEEQQDARFAKNVQSDEQRRAEADAAECGYGGD